MRNSIMGRIGAALAIALGMASAPGAPTINFNPTPKGGKKYPFSSDRQHRRHARTQINVRQPNGYVTLETLPSHLRRTEFEIDSILAGNHKIGTVE